MLTTLYKIFKFSKLQIFLQKPTTCAGVILNPLHHFVGKHSSADALALVIAESNKLSFISDPGISSIVPSNLLYGSLSSLRQFPNILMLISFWLKNLGGLFLKIQGWDQGDAREVSRAKKLSRSSLWGSSKNLRISTYLNSMTWTSLLSHPSPSHVHISRALFHSPPPSSSLRLFSCQYSTPRRVGCCEK